LRIANQNPDIEAIMASAIALALYMITGFTHLNTIRWDSSVLQPIESFFIEGYPSACVHQEEDSVHLVGGNSCISNILSSDDIYITFKLQTKEVVIHGSSDRYLCLNRQFNFVTISDGNFVAGKQSFLDEVIPLRESIYLDAYILSDWKQLSEIINGDGGWTSAVCAGIDSHFRQSPTTIPYSRPRSTLLTSSTSVNFGSPASLHYWEHRCRRADGTREPENQTSSSFESHASINNKGVYLAELWHINKELLTRANAPFIPFHDAEMWPLPHTSLSHLPSSPCGLQEVHTLDYWLSDTSNSRSDQERDVAQNSFNSPCLEHLFETIGGKIK
jgi:hypothetical protein